MSDKKNIEISGELYDAIQQLKQIFAQMSGKPIENDEDVLSILVSGFIDSVMHDQEGGEGHDHAHGHHHAHECACGDEGCENCEDGKCACKH